MRPVNVAAAEFEVRMRTKVQYAWSPWRCGEKKVNKKSARPGRHGKPFEYELGLPPAAGGIPQEEEEEEERDLINDLKKN